MNTRIPARAAGVPFLVASTMLLILPLGRPSALRAQDTGSDTRSGWNESFVVGARLMGGSLRYDRVASMPDLEGSVSYLLGATLFLGPPFPNHIIGFDLDGWGLSRSYRSTIEGAEDPRTDVSTSAFGLGTRIGLPVQSPVGLYVLGGFTYVSHTMKVAMQPAWFLPGLPNSREEEAGGWRPYWGFAADVRIRDVALGIEHRSVSSNEDFPEYFGISDAAMGGSTLYVGISVYAGRSGCSGWNPFGACEPGGGSDR